MGGSYRVIGPVSLMSAGVMTGTNKVSSQQMNIGAITHAAIQAVWTGTPTGSIIVEGSVDGATWTDMQADRITQPAGSPGSALVEFVTAVPFIRLSYTNASGTGSLTVTGSAKGV